MIPKDTRPDRVIVREWPRMGISPTGQRARFDCIGDLPRKWRLEVPLPEAEPVVVVEEAPPPKRRGRPPKVVADG